MTESEIRGRGQCGHLPPIVLGGQGRLGSELVSTARAMLWTLAGAIVALLWFACGSSQTSELQAQPVALALPAMIATPATLPAHATPGPVQVIDRIRDSAGAVLQLVTDPDVVRSPVAGYVMAVHATRAPPGSTQPQNVIAITRSADGDGIRWSPLQIVLSPRPGQWDAQGDETPSLAPPTSQLPWTLMHSGYPGAPGALAGRHGRTKGLYLATAPDVGGVPGTFQRVTAGPVIGPEQTWATPYVGPSGVLDGGLDEPSHVISGTTWLALVGGTSYAAGQTPCIGLAFSVPPYSGRAWLLEPDPVIVATPPLWVCQADLVLDPRDGSWHCWCAGTITGGGEGIWHYWSTDLRNWVLTGGGPVLRTTQGTWYGSRCFGPTAVLEQDAQGAWSWVIWFSGRPAGASADWSVGMGRAAA